MVNSLVTYNIVPLDFYTFTFIENIKIDIC